MARWALYLVSAIIAVHLVYALTCAGLVVYYSAEIVAGRYDPHGKCMKILDTPLGVLHDLLSPAQSLPLGRT